MMVGPSSTNEPPGPELPAGPSLGSALPGPGFPGPPTGVLPGWSDEPPGLVGSSSDGDAGANALVLGGGGTPSLAEQAHADAVRQVTHVIRVSTAPQA